MDKNDAIKKAKVFSELIKSDFNPSKVFLYGSYANGNWNEDSDIDIAVVVNSLQLDYIASLSLLYKLRRNIDILIEPVLFIEGKDPSGFLAEIEKNGKLIYSIN
jgi:predicted nucleotidyltransferase